MSWNHRVIRRRFENPVSKGIEECFTVHEVHYDDNNQPELWTAEPVEPYGESLEELMKDIERFKLAFNKPVLHIVDGKLVEI